MTSHVDVVFIVRDKAVAQEVTRHHHFVKCWLIYNIVLYYYVVILLLLSICSSYELV